MFRITRTERRLRIGKLAAIAVASVLAHGAAFAQNTPTLKSTIVVLAETPELRAELEDRLVAKAREHQYNAVPSHDLVPDITDVNNRDFVRRMLTNDVGAVLMVRPAATGRGSSLESVRDSVDPAVFANMRRFAGDLSPFGADDLLAVVHLAIYLISIDGAELIGSGAVWLDEPNPNRDEGIERLGNLIVANVDGVRPAIRRHLGLPPLQ